VNHALPPDSNADDLARRARRVQRLVRLSLGVFVVFVILILVWLIPVAIRFPAASLPALGFATIGYAQARRSGAREFDNGSTPDEMPPLQARALAWGLVGGAVSYAALTLFGVGVPNPNASLAWRVIGGLTFGAGAGVAAGFVVTMVGMILYGIRFVRRAA
jgi:hypothetical protein